MKQVSKYFHTIRQAEKHQDKLYDKYNSVRLVSFPITSEAGTYIWKVE